MLRGGEGCTAARLQRALFGDCTVPDTSLSERQNSRVSRVCPKAHVYDHAEPLLIPLPSRERENRHKGTDKRRRTIKTRHRTKTCRLRLLRRNTRSIHHGYFRLTKRQTSDPCLLTTLPTTFTPCSISLTPQPPSKTAPYHAFTSIDLHLLDGAQRRVSETVDRGKPLVGRAEDGGLLRPPVVGVLVLVRLPRQKTPGLLQGYQNFLVALLKNRNGINRAGSDVFVRRCQKQHRTN